MDRKLDPLRDVAECHALLQVGKDRILGPADRLDLVAGAETGPPGRTARPHARHLAGEFLDAEPECPRGHQDREDHVHDHACRDDRHAFRHTLGGITPRIPGGMRSGHGLRGQIARCQRRPRPLGLLGRGRGIVVLPEHLHVAAEGQRTNAILRFAPLEAREFQAADVEAEKELLALHAAGLRHEKVAQFVHEDDEPEAEGHLQNHKPTGGLHDPFQPSRRHEPRRHEPCRRQHRRHHQQRFHHHTTAHLTTSCLAHASSRRTSSSEGSG